MTTSSGSTRAQLPSRQQTLLLPNNEENTALQLSFAELLRRGRQVSSARSGLRVKHISVGDTSIELKVVNSYPANRLLLAHGADNFAIVSFAQLRLGGSKECCQYISEVLTEGVRIDGQQYHLGQSNSQLQNRTCVLYRCQSKQAAGALVEQWGCFADIDSTAKRAKRIGLLFSTIIPVTPTNAARPIRCKVIADVERNGFTFTDGCGYCSTALAKHIAQQQRITCGGEPYVPSMLQIRYLGFKGTVQVAACLDGSGYHLLLRRSMKKFNVPGQQRDGSSSSSSGISTGVDARASSSDAVLGLVEYSRPYKFGYLNMQTVMLLSGLGVADAELLRLQEEYLCQVAALSFDVGAAFTFLAANGEVELLEHLVEYGIDARMLPQLQKIQRKEMEACRAKQQRGGQAPQTVALEAVTAAAQEPAARAAAAGPLADAAADGAAAEPVEESSRVRILVRKSRMVFGICDPTEDAELEAACSLAPSGGGPTGGHKPAENAAAAAAKAAATAAAAGCPQLLEPLRYGECFFQPTIDGRPCILQDTFVVVVRNPCYHLGDLLVLKCVDKYWCRGLRDVLVLPTQGRRPHADESAGGDLDGDQFFVSWDPGLIPARSRLQEAPLYPAARAAAASAVGPEQLIRYFADFDNRLLARMNSWYLRWADLKGPACEECCMLALLFARGVDAVSTGVKDALPERLEPPEPSEDSEQERSRIAGNVWNVLLRRASAALAAYQQDRLPVMVAQHGMEAAASFGAENVMTLLDSRDVCISEYELLRLCAAWCRREGVPLEQLALFIDFAEMDHLQKRWALQAGVPERTVYNALNQSALLTTEELAAFQLGTEQLHWKLLAAGDLSDALAFHRFHFGMASFPRKLLVLRVGQPPASLQTVALYLTQPVLPGGEEVQLRSDSLAFLFAGPIRRKMELMHHRQSLQAELTSTRFQVYWNHKKINSFLLLADQTTARHQTASGAPLQRQAGRGQHLAAGRSGPARGQHKGRGRGGDTATGRGRGDAASRWQTGAPPAAELLHRPVLASIAVIEFDRRAYLSGSIQRVQKTALHSYELYVVSEARPLQPAALREAGTEEAFWQEAAAGANSETGGLVPPQTDLKLLLPKMAAATPDDLHLAERALHALAVCPESVPSLRAAAAADCEELALKFAQELKLVTAMQLLEQAGCWGDVSDRTWRALLSAAARLCDASSAVDVVERWLGQVSTPGSAAVNRLSTLVHLLDITGVLGACPALCLLLWEELEAVGSHAVGHTSSVAGFPAAAATLLVKAAVAACSSDDVAAQDLLGTMLKQFRQLPRSFQLFRELLQACVRSCANRAAAAGALAHLCQHWEPPPPEAEGSSQLGGGTVQHAQALPYVLHWGRLLTLDLLTEIRDAELALQSAAVADTTGDSRPGASALFPPDNSEEQPAGVPLSTLWERIAPLLHALSPRMPGSADPGGRAQLLQGGTDSTPAGTSRVLVLSNLQADTDQDCQHEPSSSADAAGLWNKNSPPAAGAVHIKLYRHNQGFSEQDRLQVGDLVRLSDMRTPNDKVQLSNCSVEGVVVASAFAEIKVALARMPPDAQDRLWRLQRLCNLTTYERSMEALSGLERQQAPAASLQLVVDTWGARRTSSSAAAYATAAEEPGGGEPLAALLGEVAACNPSQLAALAAAASRPFTLIHGPPGTGKTHTIAHLLELYFQLRQQGMQPASPMLVTAGTNVAVDNILRKLLATVGAGSSLGQPGALLRVGDAANVGKDLQRYCLEAQEGLLSKHGFDSRRVRKLMHTAWAVFTTCAGAGSSLLAGCPFSAVIIDEASQVTEPCALVPIVRATGSSSSVRCVLVGDHQQLGPVVTQDGQAEGLHIYLFERLQQCTGLVPLLLDTQYRMHPDIAAFPNRQFYGGRLHSSASTAGSNLPPPLSAPVTFVDVPDGRESIGCSKYNSREASVVGQLVAQLLSPHSPAGSSGSAAAGSNVSSGTAHGAAGSSRQRKAASSTSASAGRAISTGSGQLQQLTAADIGIITPYQAQAERLRSMLQGQWPQLEISTVDAFQGREKGVIIITTVRANQCGRLGFVSDRRRLNVALTRAMKAVAVVGHQQTLCSDPLWRSWIAQAPKAGAE